MPTATAAVISRQHTWAGPIDALRARPKIKWCLHFWTYAPLKRSKFAAAPTPKYTYRILPRHASCQSRADWRATPVADYNTCKSAHYLSPASRISWLSARVNSRIWLLSCDAKALMPLRLRYDSASRGGTDIMRYRAHRHFKKCDATATYTFTAASFQLKRFTRWYIRKKPRRADD